MSTFPGQLSEFPGVSIDRFDGENRTSTLFFLSHCHTDHMTGLQDDLPGPLYVSEISAVILRKRFPRLQDIRTLEIGVETKLTINGDAVHVTTIPAGHCPGSVMFLFESLTTRVLYTGDFRLRDQDVRNIRIFQEIQGKLDNLYVDSTFLSQDFEEFPSRVDSTDAIVELIEEWISKSPHHIAWIKTPARYGSEYLFKEIHRRTGKSLHIDLDNLSSYFHIPDMDGVFTVHESQIHACWTPGCFAMRSAGKEIREIRPTAMFWRKWKVTDPVTVTTPRFFRVCYSSHSSLRELRDFIGFLKPRKVELNVIPTAQEAHAAMFSLLREILTPGGTGDGAKGTEEVTEEEISFRNIKFREISLEETLSEEFEEDLVSLPKRKKY